MPDEGAVLEAASMAVRDYQKGQLYQSNKTKMENYMKRRREDTRFNVQPKEDVLEKRKEFKLLVASMVCFECKFPSQNDLHS